MNYLVWEWKYDEDACTLSSIVGFEDSHLLNRGKSLESQFPDDVTVNMDPAHPESIELRDFIPLDDVQVCSMRVVEFLRAQDLSNVEYLPVAVVNHKGKVASKDYFIVNPTHVQPCLDPAASKARRSAIDPTIFLTIRRLVLDPARITPPNPAIKIFRPDEYFPPVLVARGLAEGLQEEGFTGFLFTEIEDFEP